MTEPNSADTPQSPPTPAVMPGRLPDTEAAEAANTEASRSLDESGMDPAAIGEIRKLRKEAQRLRERLRDAETDMERAITQAAAMQRADIERIASEHLADPADLWSVNPDSAELCDEYGIVDADKVAEAAKGLIADKPHYAAEKPVTAPPTDRPIENLRSAMPTRDPAPAPSWQQVIRPRPSRG